MQTEHYFRRKIERLVVNCTLNCFVRVFAHYCLHFPTFRVSPDRCDCEDAKCRPVTNDHSVNEF